MMPLSLRRLRFFPVSIHGALQAITPTWAIVSTGRNRATEQAESNRAVNETASLRKTDIG